MLFKNPSPENQERPEREIQKEKAGRKRQDFPILRTCQVFQNQGPIIFFSA
jgi:hypothetical protein